MKLFAALFIMSISTSLLAESRLYNCSMELRKDDSSVILGKVEKQLDLDTYQELKLQNWTLSFSNSWNHEIGQSTSVTLSNQTTYHSHSVPNDTPFIRFYRQVNTPRGYVYNQIWVLCKKL